MEQNISLKNIQLEEGTRFHESFRPRKSGENGIINVVKLIYCLHLCLLSYTSS